MHASIAGDTTNPAGKVLEYRYIVKNEGAAESIRGAVTIDTNREVVISCPEINRVGNLNDVFEQEEILTCTGELPITQADLDAGMTTHTAQAVFEDTHLSNSVSFDYGLAQTRVFALNTKADLPAYDRAGQEIVFTYTVVNSGNVTLNSAPFTIHDSLLDAPLECGSAAVSLLLGESITCTASISTAQADLDRSALISNTQVTDGAAVSEPSILIVANNNLSKPVPDSPKSGSTIQHTVASGEWLMQIARCYGSDYDAMRRENPGIFNPNTIRPGVVIQVPAVGSVGPIFGPPCVVKHTVSAGDTWESISEQYNARVDLLKRANPVPLAAGVTILVLVNSTGETGPQTAASSQTKIPDEGIWATATGRIGGGEKISYLRAASRGEKMGVDVTASGGSISMTIYDPDGNMILDSAD